MTIRIAFLGAGVVGSAALQLACRYNSRLRLEKVAGEDFEIAYVLVQDIEKKRKFIFLPEDGRLTTDFGKILSDPRVDIVVSLLGDAASEFEYCLAALNAGKAVVTANKVMISRYGPELFAAASQSGKPLQFEAAVGGGIPLIDTLVNERLAVNEITSVQAIINGTTNFILTEMADKGADYEETLREAQALGYAEPDPSFDVEGNDAAFKLAVLASLTFKSWVDVKKVHVEGINQLSKDDFWFALRLGYTIKPIASARRNSNDDLDLWVGPAMVKKSHFLASVGGATNAVVFEGSPIGSVVYQGPGAGGDPTAASIWSDVVKVIKSLASSQLPLPRFTNDTQICLPGDSESHYAIRLLVKDEKGVTRDVSGLLADAGISIDEMLQPSDAKRDGQAEVVFTTDFANRADVFLAVSWIRNLPTCLKVTSILRVIS